MVRRAASVAVVLAVVGWIGALGPEVPAARSGTAATQPKPVITPTPVAVVPAPKPKPDCKKLKCIALTFDDGPMSPTTRLLKTLAAHKAKATFFLVGAEAKARPELVRKELAEGHELGNHSYTHADLGRSSLATVKSQIGKTQTVIHDITGVWPKVFRPPYGSTDAQVAKVAKQHKLPQILWTVDPLDWRDRNAATVERRVVSGARRNYIVLMHDIHSTTVDAVPNILKRLAKAGYTFVTVSDLYGVPLTPGKKYSKA